MSTLPEDIDFKPPPAPPILPVFLLSPLTRSASAKTDLQIKTILSENTDKNSIQTALIQYRMEVQRNIKKLNKDVDSLKAQSTQHLEESKLLKADSKDIENRIKKTEAEIGLIPQLNANEDKKDKIKKLFLEIIIKLKDQLANSHKKIETLEIEFYSIENRIIQQEQETKELKGKLKNIETTLKLYTSGPEKKRKLAKTQSGRSDYEDELWKNSSTYITVDQERAARHNRKIIYTPLEIFTLKIHLLTEEQLMKENNPESELQELLIQAIQQGRNDTILGETPRATIKTLFGYDIIKAHLQREKTTKEMNVRAVPENTVEKSPTNQAIPNSKKQKLDPHEATPHQELKVEKRHRQIIEEEKNHKEIAERELRQLRETQAREDAQRIRLEQQTIKPQEEVMQLKSTPVVITTSMPKRPPARRKD